MARVTHYCSNHSILEYLRWLCHSISIVRGCQERLFDKSLERLFWTWQMRVTHASTDTWLWYLSRTMLSPVLQYFLQEEMQIWYSRNDVLYRLLRIHPILDYYLRIMCGHFIPISIVITKLLWINVIYGKLTMFAHAFQQTLLNITKEYLQLYDIITNRKCISQNVGSLTSKHIRPTYLNLLN